jgi:hypothetical protein
MQGDDNQVTAATLTEIKVMVARIEERQIASQKHMEKMATSERVEGLEQDITGKADESKYKALDERVKKIEGNQTWFGRLIFGAIFLAILNMLGLGSKLLGMH